ncbi:MAG: WD40 repeat domain-containing protein [Cyanobacteria bacterium P01_G01_bin.54]
MNFGTGELAVLRSNKNTASSPVPKFTSHEIPLNDALLSSLAAEAIFSDRLTNLVKVKSSLNVERLNIQSDGALYVAQWSPNSQYLAVANTDQLTVIFEAESGQEVMRFTHPFEIDLGEWSPDAKYFATSGYGTVEIHEMSTGKQIFNTSSDSEFINKLLWSPNGQYLAVFAIQEESRNSVVRVFDIHASVEVAKVEHRQGSLWMEWSPDSQYLATSSRDRTASVIEVGSATQILLVVNESSFSGIAWHPNRLVLAISDRNQDIQLITIPDLEKITHIQSNVSGWLEWSPDGQYILSEMRDGLASIIDPEDGRVVANIPHRWTRAAWSPNNQYITTASDKQTRQVFEVATGLKILDTPHDNEMFPITWRSDSQYVLTGSLEGTIRVIKIATGEEVQQINHQASFYYGASWSPDGQYIATYTSSEVKITKFTP